jgi:predicted dinucleotide-binding enzyme
MKIAVLGAGNIGSTLGKKWVTAGHQVVFGVRDPNSPKAQALVQGLGGNAAMKPMGEAIAFGEVVLLAIPWSAAGATAADQAAALEGKIVIDATNNFGGPVVNSVATLLAQAPGAKVFRAFNSLGWENFEDPQYGATQADLFYCGADDAARPLVEGLIKDVGLRPVWVGGLNQVQLVDAVGSLWVTLAFRRGMGRGLAFKLLTR